VHDVAHKLDTHPRGDCRRSRADPLREEIRQGIGRRAEQQRQDVVDEHAVHLIRHAAIAAREAGLHVRGGHVKLRRRERAGERRVRVAVDEHPVRPGVLLQDRPLHGVEHRATFPAMAATTDAEVPHGCRDAKFLKEHVRHAGAVVLAGVDDPLGHACLGQRTADHRRLDELGTRPRTVSTRRIFRRLARERGGTPYCYAHFSRPPTMVPESLQILRQLLTPDERRQARNLALFMIAGTVLEAAGVGLVLPVVAIITSPDPASDYPFLASPLHALGDPPQRTLVIGTLVAMVAVSLLKLGVLSAVQRAQFRFAFGLQSSLSQRLFRTYMMQPWPFHLHRNSAELIHNVSAATNLLTFNTTLPVITATGEALVGLSICAVLLASEPLGTLAIGATLGSGAWLFHRVTRANVAEWGRSRQDHEAQRLRHLQQGIGGIKDIAVLGRQEHFLEAVRRHSDASFGALERQLVLQQMPRLWVEFFAVFGMVGFAASMVLTGRPIATVGPILGLFAAAAFRLMPAVNRVMNATQSLRFGEATARVLRDELALGNPVGSGTTPGRAGFHSVLELRDLGFTYPGNAEATLAGVNLRIAKGEAVGIIGKSGAGKSTLVDLVLGLLEPTIGVVAVDGRDVRADVGAWRAAIGYVPQSIYLTDDTLRRNVALGLEDDEINAAAVDRAIAGSQLSGLVASLPERLDTMVGERGVRLSGGQRQRVGIARALYRDPDLLVLDEATSALDDATEAAFIEAVRELRGSRTILIVAHRMTTLRDCDRIYRIEGGRVEEVSAPYAPAGR